MERAAPEQVEQAGRRRALRGKDRQLVGALGLCRYLIIRQVTELGVFAQTEKATGYRLRRLAGGKTRSKVRAFEALGVAPLTFRSFAHVDPGDPRGAPHSEAVNGTVTQDALLNARAVNA